MASVKKLNTSKIQKVKKIKVKKIPEGVGKVNGHFSFNNTILNISKLNGEVLAQFSAGSLGFKGSKKSTSYAAQEVSKKIIEKAKEYGINRIELQVRKVGSGRDAVIKKFLDEKDIIVDKLIDKTPVKFGGTRSRKRPRK